MADKVEESYIFAEDVVCLKENGNSTKLGLVIKNGSNMSESEDSLDSEDEEEDRVKNGELLVCWYPSGQEEVVPESKVDLADRSLQPGDVVRHHHVRNQRSNQKGYVTDIEITADVLILGTELVIKDVNYKQYLSPLQVLSPWTRIVFGPWVGLIKNVYRRIILWLKNGSRCCLDEEQLSMLYDIADKRDEDSPFYDYNAEFFPSQAVVGPAKAFREAKWLSKIKPILNDQKQVKAVVEEVTVVKIDVEWQVCGSCPPGCTCGCMKNDSAKPPETTINEDQLDKVRIFQHYQQAEAQIGDKGYYIVKEEDVPIKETNNTECVLEETSCAKQTKCVLSGKVNSDIKSEDKQYTDGQKESTGSSINEKLDGFHRDVERLEEDVQAGCEDSLVDKTMAVNSEATMDIEHDPIKDNLMEGHCEDDQNDKVEKDNLDAARMDDSSKAETEHISESDDGDVESDGQEQSKLKMSRQDLFSKHSTRRRRRRLRHKRRMQFTVKIKTGDRVCVEVVKTKSIAHVMWQDGHLEKDVDTLDLIPTYHNDEHQFFPGYFVADKRGTVTATDEPNSHYKSDGYGVIKYGKHDDRTCTVIWFDNSGESLGVEEDVSVYDIAEHPDFVFNPGDLVVGISGSAHEVEDVTSKGGYCVAGQVICVDKEGQVVVAWVGGSGDRRAYKPQDLYKVESEDEGDEDETYSDGSHSEVNSDDSDEWETASEESNGNDANNQSNLQDESPGQLFIGLPPSEPRSPEIENVDIEALNNANNIPQGNVGDETGEAVVGFSMLSEVPTNHFFKAANEATFQPYDQSKFLSVLRKEVLLLQSSIPPGILIRGFENSMDLFSVLIQGPDDTPYEGGLFLFDIALPQGYPSSPPKVHFISYSKNGLNPNLYVDGTVCISLLGTWNGKETEVWTSKSNILQVLLSIQGLILCKEPYYNEAGYDKHRGTVEGTENSRLYNEMAILQLIDSMGNLIRSTHPVFDREIKDHFKKNGHKIIKRFKSWISHADNLNKNNLSEEHNSTVKDTDIVSEGASCSAEIKTCKIPEFPLFPLSKGFLICLRRFTQKLLEELENTKS